MSLIEVRNLKKYYKLGGTIIKALDGINIDINKGEFIALLGTSGSGKSTLLNMLAGLERPTKGTISYGNIDLTKLSEAQILSLIHISEPTRLIIRSRMPSSA